MKECTICCERKEEFKLLPCFHELCINCFDSMMSNTCPFCRTLIPDKIVEENYDEEELSQHDIMQYLHRNSPLSLMAIRGTMTIVSHETQIITPQIRVNAYQYYFAENLHQQESETSQIAVQTINFGYPEEISSREFLFHHYYRGIYRRSLQQLLFRGLYDIETYTTPTRYETLIARMNRDFSNYEDRIFFPQEMIQAQQYVNEVYNLSSQFSQNLRQINKRKIESLLNIQINLFIQEEYVRIHEQLKNYFMNKFERFETINMLKNIEKEFQEYQDILHSVFSQFDKIYFSFEEEINVVRIKLNNSKLIHNNKSDHSLKRQIKRQRNNELIERELMSSEDLYEIKLKNDLYLDLKRKKSDRLGMYENDFDVDKFIKEKTIESEIKSLNNEAKKNKIKKIKKEIKIKKPSSKIQYEEEIPKIKTKALSLKEQLKIDRKNERKIR